MSNLPGRIVYAVEVPDTSPAHFQIHLTNGTGTEDRVLVDDSYYPETDLSPDGTRIVYQRVGETGWPEEIRVYDLISGSNQLLLPHERTGSGMYPEALYAYGNVRWSPDGRSVYYVRTCGFCIDVDSLWRVDVANPANRVRLSDLGNRVSGFSGYFEVSPVTGQLLITDFNWTEEHFEFFLADESGRGREPIPTENNPRPCPAPFSPDGRAFAFEARTGDFTDIFVKVLGEPGETQVTQGNHYVGCPSWSPNGEWLVFEMYIDPPSNADLWAVSIIDGRLIQITNTPDWSELAPVWGP